MRIAIAVVTLAVFAPLSCGCKTFTPSEWTKGWMGDEKPKVEESKFARPARLAVVWSPAVLNSPGKKPTRGFGGRIYFYDAANNAVPVEGQLVVYGYDDTTPTNTSRSPDRKYAFTPEQFSSHYTPTDLGASYSVWIPWDEIGQPQREVSLLPMFTDASGQLVMGQSSKNLLPGPTTVNTPLKFDQQLVSPEQLMNRTPGRYGIAQTAYAEGMGMYPAPLPAYPQPLPAIEETSIRVPPGLARQMAQAGPQSPVPPPPSAPSVVPLPAQAARYAPPAAAATASWSRGPGVVIPPTSPTNQPLARFVRSERPAPSSPGLRPAAGRLPTPPFPAIPPSDLPWSPGVGPQTGWPAAAPGGFQRP